MNYVLDARVAIKYYVPEIFVDETIKLLDGNHIFHVPELIFLEISSIIWKKVRRDELTGAEGKKIVSAILKNNWMAYSHKNILETAYAGAETTGQTVCDWIYLALAISLSCQFVTADEKFYKGLENTRFKSNLKWIGDFQ